MPKYNIVYIEGEDKITRATSDSLEEAIELKDTCDESWHVEHLIEEITPRKKLKKSTRGMTMSFKLLR